MTDHTHARRLVVKSASFSAALLLSTVGRIPARSRTSANTLAALKGSQMYVMLHAITSRLTELEAHGKISLQAFPGIAMFMPENALVGVDI